MHATLPLERLPEPRHGGRHRPWRAASVIHRSPVHPALVVLVAAVLILASTPGIAADVDIATDKASIHFSDIDQQLLRNTLAGALEDDMDGNSRRWINPGTGNNGRIKIIRTLSQKEPRCRQVRISNTLKDRGLKASTVSTYCRDNDAHWAVLGGTPNRPVAPANEH